ncbi:NTP transferase domain-containing protein [Myxococcota bacterium]|nr:NTP transferase domain-containing protein [Myxococcota bacterium]MBU1428943.1 NTP transferase domain-containing protein [Myxococcota bacterium]MBU1898239.1 NTP transferase domain-containing protein [Myxococcota bacterium]
MAGLILAGGASSRMGQPKALLRLDGQTFAARLTDLFLAARLDPVILVVGRHWAEIAAEAPLGARLVRAEGWRGGMRASLRAGLSALSAPCPVILTHVDRPCLRLSTLLALRAAVGESPWVATHAGQPGHPVRLPAGRLTRLLMSDDVPLRALLSDARRLPVRDPGVLLNLNDSAALTEAGLRLG